MNQTNLSNKQLNELDSLFELVCQRQKKEANYERFSQHKKTHLLPFHRIYYTKLKRRVFFCSLQG